MPAGGLILERRSKKDYDFDRIFWGAAPRTDPRPLGRVERVKDSYFKERPINQEDIPACVCCTFAAINQYFSLDEGVTNPFLSWPFLFGTVGSNPLGTRPREVADSLRNQGICGIDEYTLEDFRNKRVPTVAEIASANRYKIRNFSFLTDKTPPALFEAARLSPIAIGVGVDFIDWNYPENGVIRPEHSPKFYHMVMLLDFTEEGHPIVMNWWKEKEIDIRVLSKDYPVKMAVSFEDIPDWIKPEAARTGFFDSICMALKRTF